ncbi:CgeB family protein [Sphingomonas sp.]|uniref:CgeB family protein n=1 Tax=Sphingomonas sp. TaxID=28214 RepID=UPI002C9F686D|nr:glycosyltransferase [Sphingomonas sp.]HTG38932.1 glycosyltransferase [Sphingomonas sp.]
MRIAYLTHSLESCWNHGNAHFLRGVFRALMAMGHQVQILEPVGNWSRDNLVADHGEAALEPFRRAYPELSATRYRAVEQAVDLASQADLVIVHEWNDHSLVKAFGERRKQGGGFRLLFHDTHHRAVSEPAAMRAYDLSGFDGVLAFGEALAAVYRRWGWERRSWVWHEAADTRLFRPPVRQAERAGLVWIGNWGDGERTAELEDFLFRPASEAGLPLDIHGVRYPPQALATLAAHGAHYRGWLPNAQAPEVFAHHLATVHVPRRHYVQTLPGIPTIRVFEALACGIPLVSAPWDDCEGLFCVGTDFLMARDGAEMRRHLIAVRDDADLRAALVRSGLERIMSRHSCDHRASELIGIAGQLDVRERNAA